MPMEGSFKSRHGLLLTLGLLGSNFLAFYVGMSWHQFSRSLQLTSGASSVGLCKQQSEGHELLFHSLSWQLNLTLAELQATLLELSELKQGLKELAEVTSSSLMTSSSNNGSSQQARYSASLAAAQAESKELDEYVRVKTLPLGWNAAMAAKTMVSPIGHTCAGTMENKHALIRYMQYKVGQECPDDQAVTHSLTLHGCEPLPRRRCFAKTPPHFVEPLPFPHCLWSTPPNGSIVWSAYKCKSFECLNNRKKKGVFEDCVDCFDMSIHGREKYRWTRHTSNLDYSIDEVLELKNGSIRIGLDIGGGTGTFAVRMREKNVTVVTTSLNLNGPFNNMMAMRGVLPLFVTIAARLPFFDNTLDLVHSMHLLSNWMPTKTLEFLLFDIDRVLRPGGVLWLDHFFCLRHQLDATYLPLLERLGYKRLKWDVGAKLDRGAALQEVYLSALLEKPLSRK